MHFVYGFLLWSLFLSAISVFFCSVVHDIAVGTKVRILFLVLRSLLHVLYILGWLNGSRLFCFSFYDCLCVGTIRIENSHSLCDFHTLCFHSFQRWFIRATMGWIISKGIKDLLGQVKHCGIVPCHIAHTFMTLKLSFNFRNKLWFIIFETRS